MIDKFRRGWKTAGSEVRRLSVRNPRIFLAGLACGVLLGGPISSKARESSTGTGAWMVTGGSSTVAFNAGLMGDLGLEVSAAGSAPFPAELRFRVEAPHATFLVLPSSDFTIQVRDGVADPRTPAMGTIRHSGELRIRDLRSGAVQNLGGLVLRARPPLSAESRPEAGRGDLQVCDPANDEPVFELRDCMYEFQAAEPRLRTHYMNITVLEGWANRFGRPDLAGWTLGTIEIVATVARTESLPAKRVDDRLPLERAARTTPAVRTEPNPGTLSPARKARGAPAGQNLDVSLGALSGIQQVGHEGVWPDGRTGLSMRTTACNVGDTDVPWLAPMEENHPVIAMALYRQLDGRFEQIGVSWLKHGFFAQSNDVCDSCLHHSNGTFLGVGCSDTYGVTNNGDRNYLGPRHEVDPVTARWTCRGSHFAGGEDDCIRRHDGSGHGPTDHRLAVHDADLGRSGATYFYEADYLVREDADKSNNIGSRRCTMTWNGSVWVFDTPGDGNPLTEGPAIERYGEFRASGSVDESDGEYVLAVQTLDVGGGRTRYEYALYNRNSRLGVREFRVPVGTGSVSGIGFHDRDFDPANDWQVVLEGGMLAWATDPEEVDPAGNALRYGLLYNFWFETDQPPMPSTALLTMFRPHDPRQFQLATLAPAGPSSVSPMRAHGGTRLHPVRPNPSGGGTRIGYALAAAAEVVLEVFDEQGRSVRVWSEGRKPSGEGEALWDGADAAGRRVRAGMYYIRLRAGGSEAVRSVIMLD